MRTMTDYKDVPALLKNKPRWLLWRSKERAGKTAKVPYTVAGVPYKPGSSEGLSTFAAVLAAYRRGTFDGIGYAFLREDGLVGIDLDWKDGAHDGIPAVAAAFVRRFESYAELSPSGRGLHIFVRGTLPAGARRRTNVRGIGVEVYTGERYFTVTGRRLAGAPSAVNGAQEALDAMYEALLRRDGPHTTARTLPPISLEESKILPKAFAARNGERIRRLYDGDTTGYPSPSEADAALAAYLAFYTGPNPELLERLMWSSELARPDKWSSKRSGKTYIRNTVEFAIATQKRFWRSSA